jgi:hypothetical protein
MVRDTIHVLCAMVKEKNNHLHYYMQANQVGSLALSVLVHTSTCRKVGIVAPIGGYYLCIK